MPRTFFENARRRELMILKLLGPEREADLQHVAEEVAEATKRPIALVSLVDESRQYFKGSVGVDVSQTPRAWSVCSHAMMESKLFDVPDLSADARFSANPLVTGPKGLRAYTGLPLVSSRGIPLGSLCAISTRSGALRVSEEISLTDIGSELLAQIEQRRHPESEIKDSRPFRLQTVAAADLIRLVTQYPLRNAGGASVRLSVENLLAGDLLCARYEVVRDIVFALREISTNCERGENIILSTLIQDGIYRIGMAARADSVRTSVDVDLRLLRAG